MANDAFTVSVQVKALTDKRLIFWQTITKTETHKIVAEATVTIACMHIATRRAHMPTQLQQDMAPHLTNDSNN